MMQLIEKAYLDIENGKNFFMEINKRDQISNLTGVWMVNIIDLIIFNEHNLIIYF